MCLGKKTYVKKGVKKEKNYICHIYPNGNIFYIITEKEKIFLYASYYKIKNEKNIFAIL